MTNLQSRLIHPSSIVTSDLPCRSRPFRAVSPTPRANRVHDMSASSAQGENVIFAQVSLSEVLRSSPSSRNHKRRKQARREQHTADDRHVDWNVLWNNQDEPLAETSSDDESHLLPPKLKMKQSALEQNETPIRRRRQPRRLGFLATAKPISPTISLPILVFVDMFSVSLVVPLLFQYYKAAGIVRADQREWLGSLFSTSQIVGGLTLGFLADSKYLTRRTILFLSFGGSALSYALIVFGGLNALILSRVIVGLVKQTMTVARTILTKSTSTHNRSVHMGRLTAASTIAWILGPFVGALLFKYVDTRAPAMTACALFCCNLLLATWLLRPDDDIDDYDDRDQDIDNSASTEKNRGATRVLSNLNQCFTSWQLGSAVLASLLLTWVTKATSYSQLGSFYEEMYGLEPHHRGYISSYQQALQFAVNVWLVTPIMQFTGGERRAISMCISILSIAVFLESRRSLPLFLVVLCPILSLCFAISDLSLQTLVTHVAPNHSIFSVLAALDVLQNAVSVTVPFYRTLLFHQLPSTNALMQGDPDPISWIYVSSIHWVVAAVAMVVLLRPPTCDKPTDLNKPKGK